MSQRKDVAVSFLLWDVGQEVPETVNANGMFYGAQILHLRDKTWAGRDLEYGPWVPRISVGARAGSRCCCPRF